MALDRPDHQRPSTPLIDYLNINTRNDYPRKDRSTGENATPESLRAQTSNTIRKQTQTLTTQPDERSRLDDVAVPIGPVAADHGGAHVELRVQYDKVGEMAASDLAGGVGAA